VNEQARAEITDRLPEECHLLLEFERLKDEVRSNPLAHNARKERVAEHSWFVALSVPLLAELSPEPIDVPRAVLLAIVHDLAEAFVGDTFAFGPDAASQHEREHRAMADLAARSQSAAVARLVGLWREYEEQATPEARFVKGMDAFLPILLNFTNVTSSSWVEHQVPADRVRKRLAVVRDAIGPLAAASDAMIDQAQADGYLR
jgi:putative hydrolases of HD superfamily